MVETKPTRLRIGLLGVRQEHLELLPALYRDERIEVAWIYAGSPKASVARLGSLFSFPVVSALSAGALESIDLLVRAPRDRAPREVEAPADLPVMTDAQLAALRGPDGFAWDKVPRRRRRMPVRPTPREPASPSMPRELPDWFSKLATADGLGTWLYRALERELGTEGPALLLVTRGAACRAAYGPRGRPTGVGRLCHRLVKSGRRLDGRASELAQACGLRGRRIGHVVLPLSGGWVARLLVSEEASEPAEALRAHAPELKLLARWIRRERQARAWRRLRSLGRRLLGDA